jgi:hypothetical protein
VKRYSLSHLADDVLLRDLALHLSRERSCAADVLAHLAEVEARELHLPLGYPSMHAYCVGRLHLSEDATWKRLQAARAARRCPGIFVALAEGRLHLSAAVLLAPHISPENAAELIAAATHRSKSEIEQLLAERFPRQAVADRVEAIPTTPLTLAAAQPAPGQVGDGAGGGSSASAPAPGQVPERPRVTPLSAEAFALQCTLDGEAHDDLRYAQCLMGHQPAARDLGQLVGRALRLLVVALEKRKFAATKRPRRGQKHAARGTRYIPAHVKRAVWERDSGQCTFVSESGHRCEADAGLEFDHRQAFARGGEATVEGLRLRCRAHNQYTAEQTFGAGFMGRKRAEARRARAQVKSRQASARKHCGSTPIGAAECEPASGQVEVHEAKVSAQVEPAPGQVTSPAPRVADASQEDLDVVPWLEALGYSAAQARRAAAQCEFRPEATIEQRLRLALRQLLPPHRKIAFSPVTAT